MEINKNNETYFISLSENELSIYKIEEIYSKLEKELNKCEKIELNLKNITECDTSGIQLLLSLQKYAKNMNKTLSIDFNQNVEELVRLYNLKENLN
jgi:ABC-type transporter Mla MlaB component